jgi:phosphoglycerate dehydrogenase-like enzyme
VRSRGVEKLTTLEETLRPADYVSINCPPTKETRGMMSATKFATRLMKSEVWPAYQACFERITWLRPEN